MLGFVNLFKPAGPSSTQFGARLRKIYRDPAGKLAVGHLGTLDPQAAGFLHGRPGDPPRLRLWVRPRGADPDPLFALVAGDAFLAGSGARIPVARSDLLLLAPAESYGPAAVAFS